MYTYLEIIGKRKKYTRTKQIITLAYLLCYLNLKCMQKVKIPINVI